MKRILHVLKGLARGGAEQLLINQAPYVNRSLFEYEVAYILSDLGDLVGELQQAGLRVHCLHGTRGAGWVGRLRSLVRTREIDLVHDHSPYAAIGTRLGLWRRSGPPIVYTEHSVWEFYHRATYWGNLLTYSRCDHVFAVSNHVRASIRYPTPLRFLRMPPVETLYHGLDPAAVRRWQSSNGIREELGIPEEAPVVGMVGNIRAGKGHGILLEAAVRVRRVIPDVRFVLVGHGPLESQMRRRARQMDLERTVVFAGARDDAPRVAGTFDLFALPSLSEGLAIALIEAMALGIPAVVTRVGGLTEVIDHGKQGLVVKAGDPDAFAEAILVMLQDAGLRRTLGAAARARAEQFDIRKAVRRHEEVYSELLDT